MMYTCVFWALSAVCKSDILVGLHQSPGNMIDEERAEENDVMVLAAFTCELSLAVYFLVSV